ncbi:MAG: hypothetical protein H6618_04870 [Deltaproteobacteria bacterium]|nr:hypothetical protein [Deltaproteobacteria bacterium]
MEGLTSVRGEVRAEHPRKGRNLRLFHDEVATKDDCELMAVWERRSRQAEAFQYSVRVPGWCTEDGRLLACGMFIRLDCERIRTDESLLITVVSFEYSEKEGHIASLELRPAESLQAKPFFAEKQEDIWWEQG